MVGDPDEPPEWIPEDTQGARDFNQGYYEAQAEQDHLKHEYSECSRTCKRGTPQNPCWWQLTKEEAKERYHLTDEELHEWSGL